MGAAYLHTQLNLTKTEYEIVKETDCRRTYFTHPLYAEGRVLINLSISYTYVH